MSIISKTCEGGTAPDLGKCSGCGVALVETPTFDGFLNLECPECHRCFGCRPSSEKVVDGLPCFCPVPVLDEDGEVLTYVTPCPDCTGLQYWWDPAGAQHCMRCDPRIGPEMDQHRSQNEPASVPVRTTTNQPLLKFF